MPGLEPTPISVYLTFLTSIFMHGGWAHLLGNMLFLWIFANRVEDRMGRPRFLAFYMVGGLASGLTYVLVDPSSAVPAVSSSRIWRC